jgi:hypothetical protein
VSHPKGPPPEEVIRRRDAAGVQPEGRDITPAVGTRGQPAHWGPLGDTDAIAGQSRDFADGRWSFLYDKGTRYARSVAEANGRVKGAARRMRGREELTVEVHGPFIHPPVWTWEVPLYFWFGGIASGASFVAVACDAVGDHEAAAVARKLTLGAVLPCAPLLIMDLGRPLRFLHMLRIMKVRSPMSMGAWCLSAFSASAGGTVLSDLFGVKWAGRGGGAITALLGTYLGSYTGVLLASTAVPVWNRSRALLPGIFICTATGGGAAATRLVLAALGRPAGHPTREALGTVETAAMSTELGLSWLNERRLGRLGHVLDEGRPGRWLKLARGSVMGGLALRAARKRGGPWVHHLASALYLLAGLGFRFAWVEAGAASANDDEAVALTARHPRNPPR